MRYKIGFLTFHFGDIYVEKTDEIADELATTYAKDLEHIMATAKSDADAVERLYDLIMPDICQAVKESVKEADTVEEEFTFVVVNESGEYKIIEIEY